MTEKRPEVSREYPAFYEKVVPFAIGVLVFIILVTIVFTVLVGIGALRFG